MKKIPFFLLLVVLVCVSCSKGNKTVLKASFQRYQGSDAKAILTAQKYLMWTSGDQIRINNSSVAISGDGNDVEFVTEMSPNGFAAFFPYSIVGTDPDGSNEVEIEIPSAQPYVESGGSQLLKAPMAAYSERQSGNIDLMFSNLCSLIRVSISNEHRSMVKPTMIQIYNKNRALAGKGVVSNLSTTPTLTMYNDVARPIKTAYLTFNNESMISIPRGDTKDFYVVVPPIVDAVELEVDVYYKLGNEEKLVYKLANDLFSLPANTIATIDFIID